MTASSAETLGLYISIPFCKAKCSFCNFASGVFAAEQIDSYLARVVEEMSCARAFAASQSAVLPRLVDTIYLGGGTPSLLQPASIARLFAALRGEFSIAPDAEITVECAPLQLAEATLAAFQREGVNRLSFGVQSFVDREAAAVGRTHTGAGCREELRRVTTAGIERAGVDLIAGLPHQTAVSWRSSVEHAIESGVEHVSIYLLEVDEDSRLGREALACGSRYGASTLPDEDETADWYAAACEWLDAAGIGQYEISNFARPGGQSRHNRRYWERRPYLGFGLDAHSMLAACDGAVRWANSDDMQTYLQGGLIQPDARPAGLRTHSPQPYWPRTVDRVDTCAAFEETLFLGLRLVEGVDLERLRPEFSSLAASVAPVIEELGRDGLLALEGRRLRLTRRGREISNEIFERLLLTTNV